VKLLLDLLPVIIFFGAFRVAKSMPDASMACVAAWFGSIGGAAGQQAELSAVILATLSAIAATILQIGWLSLRRLPIKPAVWISAALIVVFGGLTVWLHNEWFIKWKPSILYWIFAIVLLSGRWLWKRNLLGSLLSEELQLPPAVWDRLLHAWAAFFLVLGAANLFAAYAWTTDQWVNFKTFGLLGLTFAFSVLSGIYMARFLAPDGAPLPAAGAASSAAPVPARHD
jgi:intracellular septation protein